MPGMRKLGMDQDYYEWSPITTRPSLKMPGDARVALCVVVNLEHYEWEPPEGAIRSLRPFPDLMGFSQREYGNRVGIFRIMKSLDKYGIRGTAALDAAVAENYPFLVEECKKREWEFIGHSLTANRMISSGMTEEQEKDCIVESIQAVTKATGSVPAGWFGPEWAESTRTPALLAEQGVRYVCDWPNDEQPYKMNVPSGEMFSLPLSCELEHLTSMWVRGQPITTYTRMIKDAFDALYQDGAEQPRVLGLNLHPWLLGAPSRIKYLDEALAYITGHEGVWAATGGEIIDWYKNAHS